jgi:hypothetical protein
MNKKHFEAFACAEEKILNTEQGFSDFRAMLTNVTVDEALNTELDDFL